MLIGFWLGVLRTILFFLIAIASTLDADAQSNKLYSVNHGLSQSYVLSIEKDYRDYIWVGTQNGLNRFDGQRFDSWLTEFQVNSILNVGRDRLLLGTDNGIVLFYLKDGKFKDFKLNSDFRQRQSVSNLFYFQDNIFGVIEGNLFNVHLSTDTFFTSQVNRLISNRIEDVATQEERAFICTKEFIFELKNQNSIIVLNPLDSVKGANFRSITSINRGLQDQFLIRGKENIYFVANGKHSKSKIENFDDLSISQKLAIFNSKPPIDGVSKFDFSNLEIKTNQGLNATVNTDSRTGIIFSEEYDSKNNIQWIGLDKGLLRIQKNGQTDNKDHSPSILPEKHIWAIKENPFDSCLYIGTNKSGLYIFKKDTEISHATFKVQDSVTRILSVFPTKQGNVLIGTEKGLFQYGRENGKTLSDLHLLKDEIRSITPAINHENYLWLGTNSHGLIKYGFSNDHLDTSCAKELVGTHIYTLYCDSTDHNLLWLGSFGHGLIKYFIAQDSCVFLKNLEKNNPCPSKVICIAPGPKNSLLLGTSGQGVYSYSKESGEFIRRNISIERNLSSTVYSILPTKLDEKTVYWSSTNQGIIRWQLGEDHASEAYHYFPKIGNSIEFNGGAYEISLDTNTVYFGGTNGLLSLILESEDKQLPIFDIKSVRYGEFQNDLFQYDELDFPNVDKIISINKGNHVVVEIDLASKYDIDGANEYRYTTQRGIKEYDSIDAREYLWKYVGNSNMIHIEQEINSNKEITVHIQSSSVLSDWGMADTVTLNLKLELAPWNTTYFWVVLGALIAVLIGLLLARLAIRRRRDKLITQAKMENDKVQKDFAEMKRQRAEARTEFEKSQKEILNNLVGEISDVSRSHSRPALLENVFNHLSNSNKGLTITHLVLIDQLSDQFNVYEKVDSLPTQIRITHKHRQELDDISVLFQDHNDFSILLNNESLKNSVIINDSLKQLNASDHFVFPIIKREEKRQRTKYLILSEDSDDHFLRPEIFENGDEVLGFIVTSRLNFEGDITKTLRVYAVGMYADNVAQPLFNIIRSEVKSKGDELSANINSILPKINSIEHLTQIVEVGATFGQNHILGLKTHLHLDLVPEFLLFKRNSNWLNEWDQIAIQATQLFQRKERINELIHFLIESNELLLFIKLNDDIGNPIGCFKITITTPNEFHRFQLYFLRNATKNLGVACLTLNYLKGLKEIVSPTRIFSGVNENMTPLMTAVKNYFHAPHVSIWLRIKDGQDKQFYYQRLNLDDSLDGFKGERERVTVEKLDKSLDSIGAFLKKSAKKNRFKSVESILLKEIDNTPVALINIYSYLENQGRPLTSLDSEFLKILQDKAILSLKYERFINVVNGNSQQLNQLGSDQALQHLVEQAADVLESDIVVLYTYDASEGIFGDKVYYYGMVNKEWAETTQDMIQNDSGSVRSVIDSQTEVYIENPKQYRTFEESLPPRKVERKFGTRFYVREEIVSFASMPIYALNSVNGFKSCVGVVFFNFRRPMIFSTDLKNRYRIFANLMGGLILNAQYVQRKTELDLSQIELRFAKGSRALTHSLTKQAGAQGLSKEIISLRDRVDHDFERLLSATTSKEITSISRFVHMKKFDDLARRIDYIVTLSGELEKLRNDFEADIYRDVNIVELLNLSYKLLQSRLSLLNIRWKQTFDKDEFLPIRVRGSKFLQSAFNDIFVNAIEAIGSNGEISIALKTENHGKVLNVIILDTGTGINNESRLKIFNRGMSDALGKANGKRGSGLGLFGVKEIIVGECKGDIYIKNRKDRKGASVQILLKIN